LSWNGLSFFNCLATAGYSDDLFIPEDSLGAAMHGDVVLARLVATTSRGSEGEVLRVVRRANHRVAGVLRRGGKGMWLELDDQRVRGPVSLCNNEVSAKAEDGDAAVAIITRFPEEAREVPEGQLEAASHRAGTRATPWWSRMIPTW